MSLHIAYLVSRFPHLPETFILREMNGLHEQGVQVELYPLVVQKSSLVHAESVRWMARLRVARLISSKCLGANLRALTAQPARYLGTLANLLWHNKGSIKFLLRGVYIFPVAVAMAEDMRKREVQHVHAHYATHPALAAWVIKRMAGIPYSISVHAHDIFVERSMLCQKVQDATFVRAISQFNKEYIGQYCGAWAAKKTCVLHCGIQPEKYQQLVKKKRNQLFEIISVGSLQPYKGQRFLIDACHLLKEQGIPFHCTIVGGGELHRQLRHQIHALGLASFVDLAGPKNEDEVAALLAGAHCFALSSVITSSGKMEGIPVVIMEALASGLPVVASHISGVPELIEDRKSGLLVPPGDAGALADALNWVRQHPREADRMASTGGQMVWQDFNLKAVIMKLMQLFADNQKQKSAGEK